MPIYAYRCTSCGHAKDVLQKVSDPALADCPACGAATFAKQVTAAGFQLKGSGWYVTDFRGGNGAANAKTDGGDKPADAASKPADGAAQAEPAKKADTAEPAAVAPPPAPAAPSAS